ncbi:unnamed protein product [Wickerhamomyces anomalus]
MFENKVLTSKKSAVKKEQLRLLKNYSKLRERKKRALVEADPSSNEFYEDSVDLKRIRNFAPEDTYEIWIQEPHLNKNFRRFKSGKNKKLNKKTKNEQEFEQQQQQQEELEEEETDSEDEELEDANENDRVTRAKAHYIIQKNGLEILPHINSDHGLDNSSTSFPLYNNVSYTKKHTMVVSKLLHLNILRKNWQVAYRCFSLLIRLHHVDIRAIWPLGIEILTRLAEEKFLKTQPEGSVDEYKLRTNFHNTEISSQLELFKDEQFIAWLQTFYPINWVLNPNTNYVQLPYRVGTRDTPPVYMVNLIWALIMKQNFKKVNEKLSELLLQAPYLDDGIYYFLQGFSYQLEASSLSKLQTVDSQQVEKLMSDAKKFYQDAKERDAVFPEELINNDLTLIEKRVANNVKLQTSDEEGGIKDSTLSSSAEEEAGDFTKIEDERELSNDFNTLERKRNSDSEQEGDDEDDYRNSNSFSNKFVNDDLANDSDD